MGVAGLEAGKLAIHKQAASCPVVSVIVPERKSQCPGNSRDSANFEKWSEANCGPTSSSGPRKLFGWGHGIDSLDKFLIESPLVIEFGRRLILQLVSTVLA